MAMKGCSAFPKAPASLSLTIRSFSIISGTHMGRSYPSAEVQSVYSIALADWAIGFWDTSRSTNVGQTTRQWLSTTTTTTATTKKRTCWIIDFAVSVHYILKLKESRKRNMYLDLARELKNLWNMKVTVICIVIGALGTVPKGVVKKLEEETIQTSALLISARILRGVLMTRGDSLSLKTPVENRQLTLLGKTLKE